jgi:flagellar biosynthesis anti-sigma factor FlgM
MKIDGLQPQAVYKSFANSAAKIDDAGKKSVNQTDADRVEISSECSDLNQARKLVDQSGISADTSAQASERSEKVEALKQQIESGEYYVSSKDVARSILTGNYLDSRA